MCIDLTIRDFEVNMARPRFEIFCQDQMFKVNNS